MPVQVTADLSELYGYIGGSVGIIEGVEDQRFQGDYTDWVLADLKKRFTTNAIAVNQSGAGGISHVFEWGNQDANGVALGEHSSIPLFRLTKRGQGGKKLLSFYFVPSVVPAPLPDPNKYGFSPSKLENMNRHIFKYKAIVMETQNAITISPKWAKALFIPLASADRGYIMTKKPVTINPGGAEASGGFAQFWHNWFEEIAPGIVKEKNKEASTMIQKTGQRVIRNAAGRYSAGTKVGIAYIKAAQRTAELEMITAAKNYFSDGPVDWDGE